MIAAEALTAVSSRGRFVMALSRTPMRMLQALTKEAIPWEKVHVVQVDERVAPAGSPDRNLTLLYEIWGEGLPNGPRVHSMPVEEEDLTAAAEGYGRLLRQIAGSPPILDLVHLGIGSDGHTASLLPGDPVLEVSERDVAVSNIYQQRRRMTLTYPILNRSRRILWLITGPEKTEALARLQSGDSSIPAGRIRQDIALILADQGAAGIIDGSA